MGDTWIINIQHYLDDRGCLPDNLPGPAQNLANHIGAIITAATSPNNTFSQAMKVRCRRRPNRKHCPGEITFAIEPGDEERFFWRCPVCGDNGTISGWKGTIWDCRDWDGCC